MKEGIVHNRMEGRPSAPPRFVAEKMLGRLAKWLRILGYDTVYRSDMTREEALRISMEEGRILLTRDTRITGKDLPGFVFVVEDRFRDQIVEVAGKLCLSPSEDRLFSLCIKCNKKLQEQALQEAGQEIPEFVAGTQSKFLRCPTCRRIYWGGTHRKNMREEIAALLGDFTGTLCLDKA